MPRYYFHLVHPGRETILDEVGDEFAYNAAARREGIASLGELIFEALRAEAVPLNVSVQIVREGHGIIEVVTGTIASNNNAELVIQSENKTTGWTGP